MSEGALSVPLGAKWGARVFKAEHNMLEIDRTRRLILFRKTGITT